MGIPSARSIKVFATWQSVVAEEVEGKAVVVVDTLRATTTLNTMLANGATAVIPVAGLAQARALKREIPEAILAGERNNLPPPDFDGGNSPLEYPKDRVAGRPVVLSTTNGTQAVERCRGSRAMAAGAIINAAAIAKWVAGTGLDAVIVLSGSEGRLALEDWLAGGAILDGLSTLDWSDEAQAAHLAWMSARADVAEALLRAAHGARLAAEGMAADVRYAAELDRIQAVAVRDPDGWFRFLS